MDTRTPAPGITLVARFITRLELQKLIGAHTRFALLADCLVSGQIYLLMNLERAAVGASLIVGSEPGYAFWFSKGSLAAESQTIRLTADCRNFTAVASGLASKSQLLYRYALLNLAKQKFLASLRSKCIHPGTRFPSALANGWLADGQRGARFGEEILATGNGVRVRR